MAKARKFVLLLLLLLPSVTVLQAEEADFPVPDSIVPAVNFWTRVYTEVDTSSGFLHDARNLAIVYTRLQRDRETINTTRNRIRSDLEVLASGKRDGLTESQQQLLELWGTGVSDERLQQAAGEVRWQLGQSDRFVAGLKRSGAYRQHIEDVVRSKNMPVELAALPHVESSFHPGAYSSAAATGMWQFVRSTATRFMQVDYVVDERLDPYAATYGAMELLEYNYNALGTWPLALTAYNHGANGMARAIRDVGTDDIGEIISNYRGPRFGFASRNFYPQFLAVLHVEENAEEYFGSLRLDSYPDFQSVELDAFIDARVLANSLGVDLNDLKRDNPALQPSVWSGTKRVPRGYALKVRRNALNDDIDTMLASISSTELFADQIPDVSYVVRRGDSLSVIANRYKTSVSELVAINQLRDRHRIRIGQTLLLPQADGSVPTLVVNDTREIPVNGRYEVRNGDTLSDISDRFQVPVATILSLNELDQRGTIYAGQNLLLRNEEIQTVEGGSSAPILLAMQETPQEPEGLVDADAAEVEQTFNELSKPEEATVEEQQQEIILAQLSQDSNNTALEISEHMASMEEAQQLELELANDPADYSVAADGTIEIQAIETLGHYAEWLDIRAWDLRRLNGMQYRDPVIIGKRLKLDFSSVDREVFERQRREFHRDMQREFFSEWRIQDTEEYSIKNRDFLVDLTRERSVPMWLFLQYNPGVDSSRLQIGQKVVFPVVEKVRL